MSDQDLDRDELLQRFLDGDLSPDEAGQARQLMAGDPEFRSGAEAYRRLGHLMRELSRTDGFEAEVDRMWQRVSDGTRKETTDDVAGPAPSQVWISEMIAHRKRYWIPGAGVVAAAAAAALVVVLNVPVEDVPVKVPATAELRSRVTDISLNSASTLVFEVETGSGGTATILWVTPDGDDESPGAEKTDGGPAEDQ